MPLMYAAAPPLAAAGDTADWPGTTASMPRKPTSDARVCAVDAARTSGVTSL